MGEDRKEMPDLAGLVESAFMMGIGVMEVTREKMTAMSDELIERGRMSQSDAKKMADRMSEVAGHQQDALRKTVEDAVRQAMGAAQVPTRDEVEGLRSDIAELRAMLAEMRTPGSPGEGVE